MADETADRDAPMDRAARELAQEIRATRGRPTDLVAAVEAALDR